MKNSKNFAFSVLILLTGIILSSCANQGHDEHMASSAYTGAETLLDSDGKVHVVDENEEELTPEEQHMRARKRVNPSDTSPSRSYTKPAQKPYEDTHKRLLRVADLDKTLEKNQPNPVLSQEERKILSTAAVKIKPYPLRKEENITEKTPSSPRLTQKTDAPLSSGSHTVTSIRTGIHPGKTRLVLDADSNVPFTYTLNNQDRLFVVELSDTKWATDAEQIFKNNPILEAYITKPTDDRGTVFAVKLKENTRVLNVMSLKPEHGKNYRIVFDLEG